MLGDVRIQLSPELHVVPRSDWPEAFRRSQDDTWVAALSAPGLRANSRLVDRPTQCFLELFRQPTTITDAVLRTVERDGGDPAEVLESAVSLLESLLRAGLATADADAGAAPVTRVPLAPGTVIHDCEIQQVLHFLADTQVYRVRWDGRDCVLKTVSAEATWQKAAIRNEAAALSKITHPAVPLMLGGDTERDEPYLILQLRSGQHCTSAATALRRLPMPGSRIRLLDILARITEIYGSLHAQGVIHGDVQQRNVLVEPETSEVSVLDFGFARQVTGEAFGAAGAPVGGVEFYRAPELRADPGAYPRATTASEQYAVGCLCFELVTGSFPFDRTQTLEKFRLGAYAPPRSFAATSARGWPDLEAILGRSLSASPGARYPSMADLAAELGELRERLSASEPTRYRHLVSGYEVLSDAQGALRQLYPPLASANYGAAGLAFACYRRAQASGDGALLASALSWARAARAISSSPQAFSNTALGIAPDTVGPASLYHSALGVHLVEAIVAHASGEAWVPALRRMLECLAVTSSRQDLTTGSAGQLLACAHVLSALPAGNRTSALRSAGDAILDSLWERPHRLRDEVIGSQQPYLGIAHGWAGVLLATFTWCRLRHRPVPRRAIQLLSELIAAADQTDAAEAWWPRIHGSREPPWRGWCHGSAGHVILMCEISRSLGPDYIALAQAAARHARKITSNDVSLCCGLAGVAYAQLSVYRVTGSEEWLRSAVALSRRAQSQQHPESLTANSLYKGPLALATLGADVAAPASSVMPLCEVERS
jgi:eukaryotic-like serine/threonine-protein kinase